MRRVGPTGQKRPDHAGHGDHRIRGALSRRSGRRVIDPEVTATLVNGRARLTAGPFNWDADLPAALGGEDLAPSPTAYLLGALAGCAVAFLRDTLAPQFDVEIAMSAPSPQRAPMPAASSPSTTPRRTLASSRSTSWSRPSRRATGSMRCSPPGGSVPDLPCPAEGERGEPDDLDSQIAGTTHRRRFRGTAQGAGPRAKGRAAGQGAGPAQPAGHP